MAKFPRAILNRLSIQLFVRLVPRRGSTFLRVGRTESAVARVEPLLLDDLGRPGISVLPDGRGQEEGRDLEARGKVGQRAPAKLSFLLMLKLVVTL